MGTGQTKLELLGKVLEGQLREIDKEGKEKGVVYGKVMNVNFAELQGEKMESELKKQWKKAEEKGLKELQKKWYWGWYESKKQADDEKKWHYPDGFFPMLSISSIHRSPERQDQFIIKYHGSGDGVLIYRREGGKGLDTWTDGLEMHFQECRDLIK